MCRLLPLLALGLLASTSPYSPVHAQGYPPPPPPGYAPPPPRYAPRPPPASTAENCGTPDQFKPCPPLPRHPLPYYPANRP